MIHIFFPFNCLKEPPKYKSCSASSDKEPNSSSGGGSNCGNGTDGGDSDIWRVVMVVIVGVMEVTVTHVMVVKVVVC